MILISISVFAQTGFDVAGFDVASVRRSVLPNGERERGREEISSNPGGVTLHNVTLSSALQWAYGVKPYQVTGPAWISDSRYDISAKTGSKATDQQLRTMMQALIANRFKLKLHHESKQVRVYALIVAKGGLKMTPGDPNGKTVLDGGKGPALSVRDMPISEIADNLSRASVKMPDIPPVVDATGLTGRYSFTLDAGAFSQAFSGGEGKAPPDAQPLVDAVEDILETQLGLRAELRKMPLDILVVDAAEDNPAAN